MLCPSYQHGGPDAAGHPQVDEAAVVTGVPVGQEGCGLTLARVAGRRVGDVDEGHPHGRHADGDEGPAETSEPA